VDAVEEYTLAVRLDPAAVPAYTNRAAAYLKLKEWQAAATDCDLALTLLEGEQGGRRLAWHCYMLCCLCRAGISGGLTWLVRALPGTA
jgi:tetratricopeptide (TPR) repeat protein